MRPAETGPKQGPAPLPTIGETYVQGTQRTDDRARQGDGSGTSGARTGHRPGDVCTDVPEPDDPRPVQPVASRSEEHTSELQSLMRISYDVFCLKKKKKQTQKHNTTEHNTSNT